MIYPEAQKICAGQKTMKRYSILASIAAVGGAVAFQGSYVNLQPNSPGSPQAGHSNITGTSKAGMFQGNGSLLTNLNASEVRTGVLTLTGSSSTYMIRATNTDSSPNASALIGIAESPSGITYGTWAETKSSEGRALFGYASATSGATYGSYAVNNSTGGRAAFGLAQATSGTNYGGWFQSNSPIGVGTYARNIAGGVGLRAESSGKALEVLGNSTFTGMVGIGTSPDWPLHIKSDQLTLVRAEGTGTTGQTTAGYFSTASSAGNAIYAVASAGSGSGVGVRAVSSSPTGFGILSLGNVGVSGNVGVGTGDAQPANRLQVADNLSFKAAVHAENGTTTYPPGPGRRGLVGIAAGNGNFSVGVTGLSEYVLFGGGSGNSFGVHGTAYGEYTNFGVYGVAIGGSDNYAGYFNGLLYADSATSGVKAFMIDHPLDPENKVLTHSSVESDHRMNLYRGEVKTDNSGYATVTVPTWFEALNEDIQYQVTVIDDQDSNDFILVKVVKRLTNGKFKIRTSAPNMTVNWMLTGNRNDPTSRHFPLEVEREKTRGERGKYYVPEAYGKDRSFGIGYIPSSPTTATKKK